MKHDIWYTSGNFSTKNSRMNPKIYMWKTSVFNNRVYLVKKLKAQCSKQQIMQVPSSNSTPSYCLLKDLYIIIALIMCKLTADMGFWETGFGNQLYFIHTGYKFPLCRLTSFVMHFHNFKRFCHSIWTRKWHEKILF